MTVDNTLGDLDLDCLYSSLKKRDREILENYNDASISDNDYFMYGIQSDIVSNSLDIINNYYISNLESAGVDLSCRCIIEALVVVEMNKKKLISDLQKKIYRYSYSLVDMDNFKDVINTPTSVYETEALNNILNDKKKAINAIMQHFNCKKEDLVGKRVYKNNPSFYLQKELQQSVQYSKLLDNYPVFDKCKKAYDFFSIMLHPSCELDSDFKNELFKKRREYIQIVLNAVLNYMQKSNLVDIDSALSFNQDYFMNKKIDNNRINIERFGSFMEILEKNLCDLPLGYNVFTSQLLRKIRCLILDMMMSLSIGYVEHVVTIFKSFIEEFSIFYEISSLQMEKYRYVVRGYWLSSRLQFSCFFEDNNIFFNVEDKIKNIFDGYYKDEYKISFEKFCKNIRDNSLYFLCKENKNYSLHVRNFSEEYFSNTKGINKNICLLYELSKDMCHATGYNFNASEKMVVVMAHKAIIFSLMVIEHFVLFSSLSFYEHNIPLQAKTFIDFLKGMIGVYNESCEKFVKNNF